MRRSAAVLLALGAVVTAFGGCRYDEVSLSGTPPFIANPRDPGVTPQATPTSEPTPGAFGTGSGSDGTLTVAAALSPMNCVSLVLGTGSEATLLSTLPQDSAILLWQVTDGFATAGSQSPITMPGTAGRWEIRRVASINGLVHTLDAPLAYPYRSLGAKAAQACVIGEYTDVNITAAGTLAADPWNGQTGGIVVFAVNSTLTLAAGGSIEADQMGFSGGPASEYGAYGPITAENTASDEGGGKGGSIDGTSLGLYGRGNLGTGGGGGNADHGGGGGGANGGEGGNGGSQYGTFDGATRGRGGARLLLSPSTHLAFGGGGGGGQQDTNELDGGGRGGGVILIFAKNIAGGGTISAQGEAALPTYHGGAGGGGAGGTILVEVTGNSTFTGFLSVTGGPGGNQDDMGDRTGTGGGGGGGRVRLVNVPGATTDVTGGPFGVCTEFGNDAWGASSGGNGVVENVTR